MAAIVDCHVHAFPVRGEKIGSLAKLRKGARLWLRPFTASIHHAQPIIRHLPKPLRVRLDEVSALVPLPILLVESTPNDLKEAMENADVDFALLIAHPPFASNEFVLKACAQDPKLIPVVNVPSGTAQPGEAFKEYVKAGAKALKIHPAADGEGVDSPRYEMLLTAAAELRLPVILHTGCFHSHLLYKDPMQGQAQRFAPWFERFREIPFVLAHMNFHDPNIAFDLAEAHPNVYMDSSWQPAETIGEAVRRVGAERVLFGSDWPFVGNNISIGLKRIRECVEAGTLNEKESRLILGENASKLFKL